MKIKTWKAKDGWRWRALAGNNRLIAESGEAYGRKTDLRRALKDLAAAVLGMLSCLMLITGCSTVKMSEKETVNGDVVTERKLKRSAIAQRTDIGDLQFGTARMTGYKGDGGDVLFSAVAGMYQSYANMAVEVAKLQVNLVQFDQRLDDMDAKMDGIESQLAAINALLSAAPPTATNIPPIALPPASTNVPPAVTDPVSTNDPAMNDD